MDMRLAAEYGQSVYEDRLREAEERRRVNRLTGTTQAAGNLIESIAHALKSFSFTRQHMQPCEEC